MYYEMTIQQLPGYFITYIGYNNYGSWQTYDFYYPSITYSH